MLKQHSLSAKVLFELKDRLVKLKRIASPEVAEGLDEVLLELEQFLENYRYEIEAKRHECVAESSSLQEIRENLKTLELSHNHAITRYDDELRFYR